MRINAKELDILKDSKRTTINAEADQVRLDLIPSIMRPAYLFLGDMPTVVGAYVGGTLAQGGSLSAADLAGFTMAIASLLEGCKKCYETCKNLIKLEDDRFKHGFQIMDLLEMKPTMGLERGWMPDSVMREKEDEEREEREKEEKAEEKAEEMSTKERSSVTTTMMTTTTMTSASPDLEGLDNENCLEGDIVFDNVSFKYKGMQSSMLKNISFTIKQGSFVGICGERGAGKSTMYKLIMRLYDPSEGTITIGGKALNYYNPIWLRSQIGISVQEPAIFRFKSLKDNVIYGSEERLKRFGCGPIETEQYIEKVLRKANIWEHFQDEKKFPQGLNTKCWNLSGGEKRSVGTARALMKTPSILLLDEPTEGLDAQNEKEVMKNLLEGRPKKQTVLAIAHRLSSLQDADMLIFVGKDGKIAETGTWSNLLKI